MIYENYTELSSVLASPRRTQTYLAQSGCHIPLLDTPQTHVLSAIHTSRKVMTKNASATVSNVRYRLNVTCCVHRKGWLVGQRRKCRVDASDRVRDSAGEFVGLGRLQRDMDKDDLWHADT
jgi:hypothetical protein